MRQRRNPKMVGGFTHPRRLRDIVADFFFPPPLPSTRERLGQERRDRQALAPTDGTITIEAVLALKASWTGVCPFCRKKGVPTLDHIIPLARGGAHSLRNIQLMCRSCNSSKGSKTMKEWKPNHRG